MLPAAPPLTAADAGRWLRAGVSRRVTGIVLPALWLVAVAVAVANDNTRCTPQDPSACGPDSIFAFAFVVLLATPVLLWWMPVLGCLAGVAFALADLRFDGIPQARWAFGLHGLLCALVGVRLVRGTAEQRRIAAAVSGRARAPAATGLPAGERHGAGRFVVAAVLVLAGFGFFAWYGYQVSGERAHLHRAVQAQARVVEVRPDDSVTVEARTPSAGTRQYRIGVYDYTAPYPLHSSTPVLLDPRDPGWIRLVAEPQDVTYWQSAGAGCWLLAFCWLLQRGRWHRGLDALEAGEHPALRVRIRPDEHGHALILPVPGGVPGPEDDRPVGRLAVFAAPPPADPADRSEEQRDGWERDGWEGDGWEGDDWEGDDGWDYETQEAFGRTWRDEDPAGVERFAPPPVVEDAVLIGDLHDRGVAMLVTAEKTLLPTGRLRIGRLREGRPPAPGRDAPGRDELGRDEPGRLPAPGRNEPGRPASSGLADRWRRLLARTPPEPEPFPGRAVRPATGQLPDLPLTARPQVRTRLIGAAMVLVAFAGYPSAVRVLEGGLYVRVMLAVVLGRLAAAGAARLLSCLRLSHARFEIAGLWWTYSVPWDRLHGVRRDGAMLSVAWQPDMIVDIGPFDDPAGSRDRAEQLGATMLLLRQRALLGGLPGRQISSRLSATWIVLAGFAVLVLLTFWRW